MATGEKRHITDTGTHTGIRGAAWGAKGEGRDASNGARPSVYNLHSAGTGLPVGARIRGCSRAETMLWNIDWQGIFTPQYSLLEMVVRGTIMYAILFVFMRIVLKRQSGGIGTTDILVVVLLAEVTGNAFSTDAKSVVEGGVLVATIVFWSYVVEWMTHRFPVVEQFLHSPPLLLIENGKMLRRNMKAELITEGELMAQLREEGIDDIALVKRACMEADGMISIIKVQP